MELFIIIWIACAILAAMIVDEGHQGTAAFTGFLLGPIGVVIAFFCWGKK